jgi:predicted metal-dependent HD superfamily phosphohydrolase
MEFEQRLKSQWHDLARVYSAEVGLAEELFTEIKNHYTSHNRHYHTLSHLSHLLRLFNEFRSALTCPDCVAFAIWYHDLIYDPAQPFNEAKSADVAVQRLHRLQVPEAKILRVKNLILATERHQLSSATDDFDGRFFLDCDLSILGADRKAYVDYLQEIRQEFSMVSLAAYRRGREAVLQGFLQQEWIYQTPGLRERFEGQARSNLQFELSLYQGWD